MVTQNIEKLRVLDFDDTIANTTERVRVETPAGPKLISSSEFAVYDFAPGETLDPNIAFALVLSGAIKDPLAISFILINP